MKKSTLSLFIFCLTSFGCASHTKETQTIPDTLLRDAKSETKKLTKAPAISTIEELGKKLDKQDKKIDKLLRITNKKWIFHISKSTSYSWNGKYNSNYGDYSGISFAFIDPYWRHLFKLTVALSDTYTISETNQVIPDPDDLSTKWIDITTHKKETDTSFRVSYSVPVKFLKLPSWMELLVGVGYNWHLTLEHDTHNFSILNILLKKKASLPTGVSKKGYLAQTTMINFNYKWFHIGTELTVDTGKHIIFAWELGARLNW